MAGAQEVIMIFRCQDVSLALCVLMCTSKTLQLTASALGERKERERRQAGEKGRRRISSLLRKPGFSHRPSIRQINSLGFTTEAEK